MSKEPLRARKDDLSRYVLQPSPLFKRAIRRLKADRIEGQVNFFDAWLGAVAVVDSERKPVGRNVALIVDTTEGSARSEASSTAVTP